MKLLVMHMFERCKDFTKARWNRLSCSSQAWLIVIVRGETAGTIGGKSGLGVAASACSELKLGSGLA